MKSLFRMCQCVALVALVAGCQVEEAEQGVSNVDSSIKRIAIDGSSTVEPITARVAEKFGEQFSDVQVGLKVTGTGTGFKEMIAGRIDIANASRPIKDSEKADCEANGIEVFELKIAIDGLTVVACRPPGRPSRMLSTIGRQYEGVCLPPG